MFLNKSRLERERITVEKMIALYCRLNHKFKDIFRGCSELREYSSARLRRCPFGDGKPVCAECRVHCYNKDMRQRVRDVMRFSGPKMILYHPVMAIMHIIDNKISKKDRTDETHVQ